MDRRTIRCGNRSCTSIARLWLGVTCCAATAQTVVYDQTSNPTGGLYVDPATRTEIPVERLSSFLDHVQNCEAALGAVGQSFTASASRMNVFELFTCRRSSLPTTTETFVAHLRLGGPEGPVLATSEAVTFHEYPRSLNIRLTEFRFAGEVSLTPGQAYYCSFERTHEADTQGDSMLSLKAIKQDSPAASPSGYLDLYPGGQLYLDGVPAPAWNLRDLWFRTGYIVPEPGTWALLTLGLGALGWRWRVRGR